MYIQTDVHTDAIFYFKFVLKCAENQDGRLVPPPLRRSLRLDFQPLFRENEPAVIPRGGKTEHERTAEIEPRGHSAFKFIN